MTDYAGLLRALSEAGVDFIIGGGFAGTVHGSGVPTRDLDVVYSREGDQIGHLVRALAPHRPYPRGAPPGLPFRWDAGTVEAGLNFTLGTTLGAINMPGEIAGGGGYRALRPHAERVTLFGVECLCLSLKKLIEVKRAAGTPTARGPA